MPYDEQAYITKRKKKFKRNTFWLVTLVTIMVFLLDLNQNSGELCGSCHSMKPQYYTWQASSHNRTGCAECHADTGLHGNVQLFKNLGRYIFREVTNTYISPIRLFTKVEDERCLRCHNTDRQVSSMGDIFIPHKRHYDRKVRCEACHKSVAHGGIARRGETRHGADGWNEEKAVLAMVWDNTATTMDECMQCHFRRKVTTECKACHTGLNLPAYHRFADFLTNHGPAVKADLEGCNTCHGYAGTKKMTVKADTVVRDYSRINTFCNDCHATRPITHTDRWPRDHGVRVKKSGDAGCLVCHDVREVGGPQIIEVYCGRCHPSPHKPGFKAYHWPDLTAAARPDSSCYMCHSSNRCTGCHGTY